MPQQPSIQTLSNKLRVTATGVFKNENLHHKGLCGTSRHSFEKCAGLHQLTNIISSHVKHVVSSQKVLLSAVPDLQYMPLIFSIISVKVFFMEVLKHTVGVGERSRWCTQSLEGWRKVTAARWIHSSDRKTCCSSYIVSLFSGESPPLHTGYRLKADESPLVIPPVHPHGVIRTGSSSDLFCPLLHCDAVLG